MDVLLNPLIGTNVSSTPAYARDSAQDKHAGITACLFPQNDVSVWVGSRLGIHPNDESSDSSSSIGAPDENEDAEDDVSSKSDETQSSKGLGSFGSLEESLPVKRGLSNFFSGKTKSFVNLTEASSVNDVQKKENPLNKRRRMIIASKWSRKSSFYGWSNNPVSMPLLALNEEDEERKDDQSLSDEKEREEDEEQESINGFCENKQGLSKLHRSRRLRSFKSKSCFSLADLQENNGSQI